MKIESSNIQMDSVYSASRSTTSEISVTELHMTKGNFYKKLPFADSPPSPSQRQLTFWGPRASRNLTFISIQDSMSTDEASERFQRKLLKHILEAMRDMLHGKNFERFRDSGDFLTSADYSGHFSGTQIWYRQETISGTYYEDEAVSYRTKGSVRTTDGREIPFSLELDLSRSFVEQTHTEMSSFERIIETKDPLVINLDVPSAAVTDQKFFFDIDCDGVREEISALNKGSGFLALDKNGDGVINDGSELFGTKSGDGFAELSSYDTDGNGWIDENDPIFSQLKVWTKDSNGNDCLMDLKEADIGAIFLGRVSTPFELKGEDNKTDARIVESGIFLHESTGKAGSVQHVDFAV